MSNLENEGVPSSKIFYVGNVMIDTLKRHLKKIDSSTILEDLDVKEQCYGLVTLHRPTNVDNKSEFKSFQESIETAG